MQPLDEEPLVGKPLSRTTDQACFTVRSVGRLNCPHNSLRSYRMMDWLPTLRRNIRRFCEAKCCIRARGKENKIRPRIEKACRHGNI